jgi:hypothetical protein
MNETASKPIIHEVRGHNLHGPYLIRLRGPAEGFELSEAQARKVSKALCGLSGCRCGGTQKPSEDTARVIAPWGDPAAQRLIPATNAGRGMIDQGAIIA